MFTKEFDGDLELKTADMSSFIEQGGTHRHSAR